VAALTEKKERLEASIASRLPALERERKLDKAGPEKLIRQLPDGTAFIDLYRYLHVVNTPGVKGPAGEHRSVRYVAFVLARNEPVRRVELGESAPLDAALKSWLEDVPRKDPGKSADDLRRRVWEPLEKMLPAGTQ